VRLENEGSRADTTIMGARAIVAKLSSLSLTLLLAGLLGATLVRLGPGFGIDERELDPGLTPESVAAIRRSRAAPQSMLRFYAGYLRRLAHGDLGESVSLDRPVAELLGERCSTTLRSAGAGLALGWLGGLALALAAQFLRLPGFDLLSSVLSGALLSTPAAVIAVLFIRFDSPAAVAIALIVGPRVFLYARNLLLDARRQSHVLTAIAKGLKPGRVLLWHILPPVAPQLIALLGVSANLALTASIPVEALCDVPGIGQLAWQAALGRDLPVLVAVTLLVTAVTLAANLAGDWTAAIGSQSGAGDRGEPGQRFGNALAGVSQQV
jgi:peptide/nickel transport system permease protein